MYIFLNWSITGTFPLIYLVRGICCTYNLVFIDFSRYDSTKINLDLFAKPPVTRAEEFVKLLLLEFHERSSLVDKEIRRAWCSSIFRKNDSDDFEKLTEILHEEVNDKRIFFLKNSNSEFPLGFDRANLVANKLAIALYFRAMMFGCQLERTARKDDDVMLLKDYSAAVCSGESYFL